MHDPTPSMADLGIDPEAAATLLPHIDSFVKWELLRFLYENPNCMVHVEDLARYMGRDEMELKPAARALAGGGFIEHEETESGHAYGFTKDDTLRSLTGGIMQAFLSDRLVRLAISSHILKARRKATNVQFAS